MTVVALVLLGAACGDDDDDAAADDEPGSYVVSCFVPVGGAEDGAPHFMEGMTAEFEVA